MDQIFQRAVESLMTGGIPGAILVFILWKVGPVVVQFRDAVLAALQKSGDETAASLRNLEAAVHRRALADLMRLATDPQVSDKIRDAAKEIVQEIERVEKARELAKASKSATVPPNP